MSQRYCIGCKHLRFSPPESGSMGSEYTGWMPGEDAKLACAKHHWEVGFNYGTELFDIQSAMESAKDCADYSERVNPADL